MIDTFCKALVGMGKGFMYFCFMVFFETFWYGKREYESLL
ncbi:conserved hypothetical protein [Vibrio cholerae MO10]|uniref:Uncharacterized protein n=3 Tax=Vibrio cholerae TaxID=666 RepID=Q9KUK7_VIBCH|nr:hypothetical protein VC_0511 [Vibrio cholerae O1 biovar El Tor str. N16961]AIC64154.1 hypothetical protein VC_0511 [Vibrio cholerae]EET24867.1 conserved hypothetical protein [Vibrio cholerae MO10]AIC64186.1 hypothetical protein VC_0511 [Vibrio cholerae]AIC64214.1 hypothetical protein VC_0511 [Vibrio cholerae]